MATAMPVSAGHAELLRIIRKVRNRWRTKVALRGAVLVAGWGLLALVGGAAAAQHLVLSAGWLMVLRAVSLVILLALVAYFLVRPLARRVPDERIALYVEENEPSLDAALLSAVELGGALPGSPDRSPALGRRVIENAIERARAVQYGERIERPGLYRYAALLAAVVVAGAAIFVGGPALLRTGARMLVPPWRSAPAPTYGIAVTPGNATIARGGDQEISARLTGFSADSVELVVRRGEQDSWARLPMAVGADSARFAMRLFDIAAPAEYYVEAGGVRSPLYHIAVTDLPYVSRIDLEYHYPAYTGLAPRTVEDGGDIAAVRGTTVLVRARATRPVRGGRLLMEGQPPAALVLDSTGALTGSIQVKRAGFYKLELQGTSGGPVVGSLDYAIDVLADEAPLVTFRTPGRDSRVTTLEEVFTQVQASDDYGLQKLELVYSVNGAPEKVIALHDAASARPKELTAGHTFFLEELGLQPGDLISYFARATDADRVDGPHSASTDIYFMEVRPFERDYRQAAQRGGGGAAGGESPDGLSQQQREVIAATFKTIRDRAATSENDYRENLSTIVLSQGRLRDRVETLARQITQRGIAAADSGFLAIARELPQAAAEMHAAEAQLARSSPDSALAPEQRALQHLQRAEAAYREVQVSFGAGGGGGGGGGQATAEELADLFELQTDKLRNQYETVQQGESQQRDRTVDETLERLKRLASRQQQENERLRRKAEGMRGAEGGGGSGSGGESQRQLAAETEELARRLERLAREKDATPELQESARRLREAANAMRQSAASGAKGGTAEGAAALDRLRDAGRRLSEGRSSGLDRDAKDARALAQQIAEEQHRMASEAGQSPTDPAGRAEQQRQLAARKDSLTTQVGELEAKLDRMARDARTGQPAASRKLQEAANAIRDDRLQDKIRFSKTLAQRGASAYAKDFEEQIGASMDDLRKKVEQATDALHDPAEQRMAQALDHTRDLVQGLESLDQRVRQQGQQAQQGKQSQQGQQGQQGQTGQQGQQGQQGQRPSAGGGNGAPGGGSPDGRPGRGLTPEQTRQFAREFREQRGAAEELRRELAAQGQDVGELNGVVDKLRRLESGRPFANPAELQQLESSALEGLKAYEFALRRQTMGGAREQPLLGGSEEVPAGFRKLVEEYYRSLAKKAPDR